MRLWKVSQLGSGDRTGVSADSPHFQVPGLAAGRSCWAR
ncbi:unnamed protein product, partial [Dibothriocephalus latus]